MLSTKMSLVLLSVAVALFRPSDSASTAVARDYSPSADRPIALVADSMNDGPHVYWQNDTTAIVFYLCDDSLKTKVHQVADTLRFDGFCTDSRTEYVIPAQAPSVQPFVVDGAPRIFAVSDVHGEYEAFVDLLRNAGVIDEELHWSWGDGQLVIVGDTFDRGDRVTECLWLIYRLEQEAEKVGGRVHFVLGNHDVMVIYGDKRYVNHKYLDGIAKKSRIRYEDLYGPVMEMGRWLRSKNSVVKLNGVLFVHGGIPPWFAERGTTLEEINEATRADLEFKSYELAFGDSLKAIFGGRGVFWYRGYHYAMEGSYPKATPEQIDTILDAYDVRAIVVGHSEIDRVDSLYGGKVFGIDVPLEELGSLQGLLLRNGNFYRVMGTGDLEIIG